jgi:hypothetical protein
MNITNKYCLLRELTQAQIDKLRRLLPDSSYFHFRINEELIGLYDGEGGTWNCNSDDIIITYKEMLSLLGEEQLVPHVHHKEIIAWANGEEIEHLTKGLAPATWVLVSPPSWRTDTSYRVKSKPTPTQLRIQEVVAELLSLHKQDAVERGIEKVMGS